MAKSTREWEEALEHLLKLSPKSERAKSTGKHRDEAHAQLDAVKEANGKVWKLSAFTKAVRTKEEHEVRRCQVEVYVLQTQECCKEDA